MNKPDWHVLDKIVDNLRRQTFRDFELIIVDLCHEYRSDYLSQVEEVDFPLLHIPDKDSVFRDISMIRICSARNTGLLYARGKNVIFSDDGQEWSDDALSFLEPWAQKGAGATCRLHRDNGHGPIEIDSRWMAYQIEGTLKTKVVKANDIGYFGGTLSMAPTETMLDCNGWDEMFDGSRQLEDSDMAKRLGALRLKMALEGHPKCIEYAMRSCKADKVRNHLTAKCNGAYCYPVWDQEPNRVRANTALVSDEQLATFVNGQCTKLTIENVCSVSDDPCVLKNNRQSLLSIYKDPRLVFDLRELRKQRSWESASTDPMLFEVLP
ncbi:MAG: glycosyltransferase [Planctomycetota bacterium]